MTDADIDQLLLKISSLEKENLHLRARQSKQLRVLRALEDINHIFVKATDLNEALDAVLQAFLRIFSCERAWLVYPCDPDAATFRVPMEKTHPQWPGAETQGMDIPLDDFAREAFRLANSIPGAVRFDPAVNPGYLDEPVFKQFHIRSQLMMTVRPKSGKPWLLGIHHCVSPVTYSNAERDLFASLADRIADGISSLLSSMFSKSLFENSEVAIWNADLSEIRIALEQLRHEGVRELRKYLQDNERITYVLLAKVNIIQVNQATLTLLGVEKKDVLMEAFEKLIAVNETDLFIDMLCAIWEKHQVFRTETVLNTLQKSHLDVFLTFQVPQTVDDFRSVPISIISITKRKHTEALLRQQEELYRSVVQDLSALVCRNRPDGVIEYVNDAYCKYFDRSREELIGNNFFDLIPEEEREKVRSRLCSLSIENPVMQHEHRVIDAHGRTRWQRWTNRAITDNKGNVVMLQAFGEDITSHKEQEMQILYQAHFDNLTGLPNRFLALDRLSQKLNQAERNQSSVAVLFLDLDDFKRVNDTLGHEVGDKLLVEAAKRLNRNVRSGDTVGRLGGDEFIILTGEIATATEILPMIENLVERFRGAFKIDGRELVVTTSIGIAIYPNDGESASTLLRNADSAMYHAKTLGRNTYAYFTNSMNKVVSRRLTLEEHMQGAIGRNEYSLVYQPQVSIDNKQITGLEALLRWHNPVLGDVSPSEFVPIAEQNGLIVPIGEFVLTKALKTMAEWQERSGRYVKMAVNMSPRQLSDPNLVQLIEQYLQQYNIPGHYLELEITEGVLMHRHARVDQVLKTLSDLKINIAMDDFGTGYASMSNLRSYPFDILKIDQSFVRDMTVDEADRELVSATIGMAHGLGLKVVAEGVETATQLAQLTDLGCDYAQGYHFSKPAAAEKIATLLESMECFTT